MGNHIKQDKEVNISPNTTHKDSNKSPKNETDPGDNGVSGEDSNISKEESGKSPKDQREPSEISSGSNETLPDKTKKDSNIHQKTKQSQVTVAKVVEPKTRNLKVKQAQLILVKAVGTPIKRIMKAR